MVILHPSGGGDCGGGGGGWPQTREGAPVSAKPVSAVGDRPVSIVCLCPQWQVLNRAKSHIQEQEQVLDNLLKVKGNRSYLPPPSPSQGKKDWMVFLLKTETLGEVQ